MCGSFYRVYVNALKNARTEIRTHLLISKKLTAPMLLRFCDVFQLLDRGDDEVMNIQFRIKDNYELHCQELGGNPEIYSKNRIQTICSYGYYDMLTRCLPN
jgi:hypothetical protein